MSFTHFSLAFLVVFIWALNFVAIEVALKDMPPIFLNVLRFFLLSIPAVFFVKRPAVPFRYVLAYGLILFALSFSLLFIGIRLGVTAGLASVLFQAQAFFSLLFAILFFKEKLHIWQVLGALLSFSGIGWIAANTGGNLTVSGLTAVLLGSVAWGFGNTISKKFGKINTISLVVWGGLAAWPPLLVLSLLLEGPDAMTKGLLHISFQSAAAILYIVLGSSLFAFAAWAWLIHHHPLSQIIPFTLLVPVLGLIDSKLIMGEPLPLWKIGASLLVIAGLSLNLLGPRIFSGIKRLLRRKGIK